MIMRKTLLPFITGIILFASCKKESVKSNNPDEGCVEQRSVRDGEIIAGQYIVAFNPLSNTGTGSERMLSDLGRNILERNNIEEVIAFKHSFSGGRGGFVANLTPQEANLLQNDAAISKVEPDRIVALSTCFEVIEPRLITWNINRVGYGNGIGKTAWIIDSGIDFNHPDLTVDNARSRSFVNGQTSADDANGHGTHVAGIIGAKNNTIGVLGVASGATLVPLKVLDKDGIGKLSYIIQALAYVSTNGKAGDVINMSLGEDVASDVLDQQVQSTANRGILISIAAGNDNKQASQFSPGRANGQNIFTVSAVDSLNNFASFSNYGNDAVDYAAPGVRILSTYKDGKYAKMSGTSMAAPHVAGLLLLNGKKLNYSTSALNDPDGSPDKIAFK